MPRKSIAALSVVPSDSVSGKRRLAPPPGLSEPARLVFLEVVAANGPEHFTRADMPLLLAYCTACSMERQASAALEREGLIVGGRASPWLTVQEKQTRAMVALAMRLRLAPQSRLDSRAAGRSAGRRGARGIEALTGVGGDDDET
jgi:phage terminase small subunit